MKLNKEMRKSIREWKSVKQPQEHKCVACGGSGHYDTTGSPKCSSCNGTGKSSK